MSEAYDQKSAAQLQSEIAHTRAEMSETLDAIREKFSPGELLDQTLEYFKQGSSGQFSRNLSDTVTQNPIPTALVGIGIAWLMLSGSRRSPTGSTWSAPEESRSKIGTTLHSVTERAGQMQQEARAYAGEMRERVGEMAQSAQERIGDTAESVRDYARQQADSVRDYARQQTAHASSTFDSLRHEHPLILGALGFALGAALGAGLPPTQREDELMGETRDEYVQKAKEAGEEQLEKVQQVATAAGKAAQAQAEKEGVTQEGLPQQLRNVAEKAERVAHASLEAAKEEADKHGLTAPR